MTERETIVGKWRKALDRKYQRGSELIAAVKELDRKEGRKAVEYAIW